MGGLFSIPVLLLFLFLGTAVEGVLFSTLPRTLIVSASPKQGQVLKAGEDHIKVSWGLNQSLSVGADDAYKKVKVRLCYAPVSQTDRGWRKTNDDLKKDKTCQFGVTIQPYARSNTSFEYKIERDVPSATYFVRAYLLDSSDSEVAYGQSTDAHKSTNLLTLLGSLDGVLRLTSLLDASPPSPLCLCSSSLWSRSERPRSRLVPSL